MAVSCTRDSECAAPLTCRAGRCRAECVETRDCPTGSECLPVGAGAAACALAQDRCTSDTECTAPLICGSDGRCRAECLSDGDCTSDGRCVLAGRLVCVAPPPGAASACGQDTNADFASGLLGWCIETSSDIDASVVRPISAGFDGHAAQLDLTNAPVGAWVRLYQEVPLEGRSSMVFDRPSVTVDGGTTLLAIELIDADGFVLGRVARAVAGDGDSDCAETGRASAGCIVEPFMPGGATMSPALASAADFANVDLRRVAAVRRVVELARTGPGAVEVVLDDVAIFTPPCSLGWWREGPHLASFDLDNPGSPPAGFTTNDAPLQAFLIAECGQALAIDGTQSIDWTGALPTTYTVSFMWHGTLHMSPLDGLSFVHELGGDMDVSVVAGQIVLNACGQRIADSARIVPADQRFQEIQVLVDRAAGRVCLARSGHMIGCAMAPACTGTTPTATGLRFMEAAMPLHDRMAVDEIRIDDGVHLPDGTHAASGSCALDLACHEYMSLELRDSGSGACVAPSACTSSWLCPEAALDGTDPTLCGSTAETACVIDATCPQGVRPCDGSPCTSLRLERCTQPLAASCP
jgi:hypothetical protein